ncbi:MAG: hypothetical protein ACOX8V_02085 [Thermoleophilia bacterium]|jgi:hypothetical protein
MKKLAVLAVAVVFLVLGLSSVALAASPQDIYNDYQADQKLDGNYTNAELQAYLDNAVNLQYADPTIVAELNAVVMALLNSGTSADPTKDPKDPTKAKDGTTGSTTSTTVADGKARTTFPFTGSELLWIAVCAMALIGGGLGISRLGKARG